MLTNIRKCPVHPIQTVIQIIRSSPIYIQASTQLSLVHSQQYSYSNTTNFTTSNLHYDHQLVRRSSSSLRLPPSARPRCLAHGSRLQGPSCCARRCHNSCRRLQDQQRSPRASLTHPYLHSSWALFGRPELSATRQGGC